MPRVAEDDAARREVGALDVAHQACRVDVRIVDVGDRRGDHLAQVVRRDVRRHADGDAGGAVDEQVGEARRQDQRFAARAVVVRREVDRVHVEVAQHLGRDPRQARLGVAHRGGGSSSTEPKLPWPSTSSLRIEKSCAMRTSAS